MTRPLILYHASCSDGFCAAWVAHRKFGADADYVPVQYGQPPPLYMGRRVYILDFSYPVKILLEMRMAAHKVVVLDHHKTAAEELKAFTENTPGSLEAATSGLTVVFDMEKAGCRLAWEHFFPDEKAPVLVDYVEDRDLWRWKLPRSREVSACLASHAHDFEMWGYLNGRLSEDVSRAALVVEGAAILRYQGQEIDRLIANAREAVIAGHRVLCCNTPVHQSEIAGRLAKGRKFGACFFVRQDGKKQYSLRSDENGIDVSEVARSFGGGGQPHAAGYEVF